MKTTGNEARTRGRPGRARPLLLAAAIQEFAEKGFDGASTAGIARRAKTNQPLVHHHFGSKEELFRVVLATLFEALSAALLAPDDGPQTPRAMLRRFVLATAARPELPRIWLIESARGSSHAHDIVEQYIRPLAELVMPLIAEARGAAALSAVDPHLLLYALQGLASYPFLVPAQVERISGADARSEAFAEAYADAVLALVFREGAEMPRFDSK